MCGCHMHFFLIIQLTIWVIKSIIIKYIYCLLCPNQVTINILPLQCTVLELEKQNFYYKTLLERLIDLRKLLPTTLQFTGPRRH